MLAFSSDWTTLAGWRGLKTRLNSLRYIKGRVAKPDARHHIFHARGHSNLARRTRQREQQATGHALPALALALEHKRDDDGSVGKHEGGLAQRRRALILRDF